MESAAISQSKTKYLPSLCKKFVLFLGQLEVEDNFFGKTSMAMEMDKIELMVELQVFTHIHDQRAVHRQFIPDTQ